MTRVAQSAPGKQNQQLVARVSMVRQEKATSFLHVSMLGQTGSFNCILSPSHIPLQSEHFAPQRQLSFGAMCPSGKADTLTPQIYPSRDLDASHQVTPAPVSSAHTSHKGLHQVLSAQILFPKASWWEMPGFPSPPLKCLQVYLGTSCYIPWRSTH